MLVVSWMWVWVRVWMPCVRVAATCTARLEILGSFRRFVLSSLAISVQETDVDVVRVTFISRRPYSKSSVHRKTISRQARAVASGTRGAVVRRSFAMCGVCDFVLVRSQTKTRSWRV